MRSLQNLCLNVIAEEFERFHPVFEKTKNVNLKRSFEFLQRTYSAELASRLFKRKKLKNEYLEFVLNERLQFLDERWIKKSHYSDAMKDILRHLPNLKKLHCIQSDDEILEIVAKFCPKLVEICATISSFTDQGVAHLCNKNEDGTFPCPDLKRLYILQSEVSVDGVIHLIKNLTTLEKLGHEEVPEALYDLHENDLPELKNAPTYNLTKLDLFDYEPDCHDLLKICLTVCPQLKSLSCTVAEETELDFFNNTYLEDLHVKFLDRNINIDNFLQNCCHNLTNLTVHNCIMSVAQLVVSCPKLKYLSVDNISFTSDTDSEALFQCLVSCSFLMIEDNILNDRAMRIILLSAQDLAYLTIFCCDLSPELLNCILKICNFCALKKISFESTVLEADFVKEIILNCPTLKTLDLGFCDGNVLGRDELIQFVETLKEKPRICGL